MSSGKYDISKEISNQIDQIQSPIPRPLRPDIIHAGSSSTTIPPEHSRILDLAASSGAYGTSGYVPGDASSSSHVELSQSTKEALTPTPYKEKKSIDITLLEQKASDNESKYIKQAPSSRKDTEDLRSQVGSRDTTTSSHTLNPNAPAFRPRTYRPDSSNLDVPADRLPDAQSFVSSQKSGADQLVNPGQKRHDKSSSANLPQNIEMIQSLPHLRIDRQQIPTLLNRAGIQNAGDLITDHPETDRKKPSDTKWDEQMQDLRSKEWLPSSGDIITRKPLEMPRTSKQKQKEVNTEITEKYINRIINRVQSIGNEANPSNNEEIQEKILDKLTKNRFINKKTTEEYLEHITSALQLIGNEANPLNNEEIQGKILDKLTRKCFNEQKSTKECIIHLTSILQLMGDKSNPWGNAWEKNRYHIRALILNRALNDCFNSGKSAEECINIITDTAQLMSKKDDPRDYIPDNITPNINEIHGKILNRALNDCFNSGKSAEECINIITDTAQLISDKTNLQVEIPLNTTFTDTIQIITPESTPLGKISINKQNGIKEAILNREINKYFNNEESIEGCTRHIKDTLRLMGNETNPWDNIRIDKQKKLKWKIFTISMEKIWQKSTEKIWQEGKGVDFAERAEMYKKAARDSAILADFNGFDLAKCVNHTKSDLIKKKQDMKNDMDRWTKRLPGRGWSTNAESKNYESYETWRGTLPHASDSPISQSNNQKQEDIILRLYWEHGARASLKIDQSKLTDPTFAEKMHPFLNQLQTAEQKLRRRVQQICNFQLRTERMEIDNSANYNTVVASLRTYWISPAFNEYNIALNKAEEAYKALEY